MTRNDEPSNSGDAVTIDSTQRVTFKQRQLIGTGDRADELRKRFTHANHGVNVFMPFFTGGMADFPRELFRRAESRCGLDVAIELFDDEKGVCAYNHTTKMVFAPADISPKAYAGLCKLGYLTTILVCVRAGFLDEVLFASSEMWRKNVDRVSAMFAHMRAVHNAEIFVVGYYDDQFFEPETGRDLRIFIDKNSLRVARASRGYGMASAIRNAKYRLNGEVFSRTLYMDNRGRQTEETDDYYESGFDVANEAHAAPLISMSIFKCPKCNEPWLAPIRQNIER